MKKALSIVVISVVVLFALLTPGIQTVDSEIDNEHKRIITVDNSANPDSLTDYQVNITVTYDSNMQNDFDDLRFTWYDEASDEEVAIDYWLDKYVDSEYALVWVEVPSIKALGQETLYMYYGDPDATSGSNGEETFVFFDGFSTDTTANYGIFRNEHAEISWNPNGWLVVDASERESPGRNSNVRIYHKTAQIDATEEKYWLETRCEAVGTGLLDYIGPEKPYKYDSVPKYYYAADAWARPESCFISSIWGWEAWEFREGGSIPNTKDEWYRIGLGTSPDGTVRGKFSDDDYNEIETVINQTVHQDNEWWIGLAASRQCTEDATLYAYFDYVRVRKFTDPEPYCSVSIPEIFYLEFDGAEDLVGNEGITGYVLDTTEADLYMEIFKGANNEPVFAGLSAWCLFSPPMTIEGFTVTFPAITSYYYKLTGISWGQVVASIAVYIQTGEEWNEVASSGIILIEDFWALGQSEGEKEDYTLDIAYTFSEFSLQTSETYKIEIQWATNGYIILGTYLFSGHETYGEESFYSLLSLSQPRISKEVAPIIPYSVTKPDGLAAVVHSPVELYVTDPLGRSIGVDPVSEAEVNEIPGAYYSGMGSHPQAVAVPFPLDGLYNTELHGTDHGSYELALSMYLEGSEIQSQVFSGEVVDGTIYVYKLNIAEQAINIEPDPATELEYLKQFLAGLPDNSFDKPMLASQRKNALFNKIDEVILKVEAGNYTDAVNKLCHDMRTKMDGDSTAEDWIICLDTQHSLCIIIDHIISSIEMLQQT